MSTQQDIYAAGFENYPPMLNKDNYVPWSSRLFRSAKSKLNGKLLVNSIKNDPYVRQMIHEPGDPNGVPPVAESTHEQKQIAQPGMNMGQDRQIQIVEGNGRNQFRQYVGQNVENQNGYNAIHNVRNQVVQNPAKEFDLMAAARDLDEIEEVNANSILMANLQQASTSDTQTDKAPVYDSDRSTEVH
nr:ribonuclease H-like domain-containing protein [Tanacetum cinerariifolium]